MNKTYIVLHHIRIQNANAMSSCYTIGFPAMTAWLGAVHAWQRKLRMIPGLEQIELTQTAVISHQCQLQVYKDGHFSIIGTANPLKKNKRTGDFERPPFIEEARIHLDVSLVIEAHGVSGDNEKRCKAKLQTILWQTKLASGDVVDYDENIEIKYISENTRTEERNIICSLMPGYALIERSELLQNQEDTSEDKLDALLDFLSIHVSSEAEGEKNTKTWHVEKKEPGWLVPIAIGFKGISPLGKVENQRDETVDHCFVESVVTLGEFKMTYRFQSIEDMMWHYEYDAANQLYICKNETGGMQHG